VLGRVRGISRWKEDFREERVEGVQRYQKMHIERITEEIQG
jgi:hypothetical protein